MEETEYINGSNFPIVCKKLPRASRLWKAGDQLGLRGDFNTHHLTILISNLAELVRGFLLHDISYDDRFYLQ